MQASRDNSRDRITVTNGVEICTRLHVLRMGGSLELDVDGLEKQWDVDGLGKRWERAGFKMLREDRPSSGVRDSPPRMEGGEGAPFSSACCRARPASGRHSLRLSSTKGCSVMKGTAPLMLPATWVYIVSGHSGTAS